MKLYDKVVQMITSYREAGGADRCVIAMTPLMLDRLIFEETGEQRGMQVVEVHGIRVLADTTCPPETMFITELPAPPAPQKEKP